MTKEAQPRLTKIATTFALILLTTTPVLVLAEEAPVAASEPLAVTLPESSLEQALLSLGKKFNVDIFFSSRIVQGKRAAALNEKLTLHQAVAKLLAGTQLHLERKASGEYFIKSSSVSDSNEVKSKAEVYETPEDVIDTILVMGERSNRSLRDTVTSVSIFDAGEIDTAQYQNINDAIASAINLTTDPFGVPSIRGVDGSGAALGVFSIMGGSQPRVSTIVDGTSEPFFAANAGDSGIWDLQRIEVLRGPQSTIQGRNSIGGALVITTQDPSFEAEGKVRVGYQHLEDNREVSAMYSAPLIDDELAFRITAQHFAGDTFIDYPVPDGLPERPFDPTRYDATNLSAKLLWMPTVLDGFSAKLTYRSRDEQAPGFRNMASGPDYSLRQIDYNRTVSRDQDTQNSTFMLDLAYDFTDNLSAQFKWTNTDYDWGFHEFGSFIPQLPGAPDGVNNQNKVQVNEDNTTLDARLIYNSDDDAVKGYLGLFRFERDQDILRLSQDFTRTFVFQPGCSTEECPLEWFDYLNTLAANTTGELGEEFDVFGQTEVTALYMEVDFAISDSMRMIIGGRYEEDQQYRDFQSSSFFFSSFSEEIEDDIFLPRIALSTHVTEDTTLGVSVARGYTAGGLAIDFSFGSPVEPYVYDSESVRTYEISTRTSLQDGRSFFSANLFYSNFDNYQQVYNNRVSNLDEASNYGLELQLSSTLTDSLELTLGLGLLNTEVDRAQSLDLSLEGNDLTQAPEVTAMLGVNYRYNEAVSFDVRANYVSEYYATIAIGNQDELQVGNYLLANIGANIQFDGLDLRLYANNVTDRDFVYNLSGSLAAPEGQVSQPRTFGISAAYQF